jgi:competence protein ComFB
VYQEKNMAFIDDYNFEFLVNEAEKLVLRELERQLEGYPAPVCNCNDCVVDMAAMALNTVKPIYRVSLLGTLYASRAMEEESYAASIKEAVSNSIERVRENPGHEIVEETVEEESGAL